MGSSLSVLIVGASGFIGRALVSFFAKRAVTVVAVSRTDISPQWRAPSVHYHCSEDTNIAPILAQYPDVDAVVFAAGRAHQRDGDRDMLPWYLEVNRDLALRCAEATASAGVGRFIYLSSIGVNGSGQSAIASYDESMAPNPVEPYAVSKLMAEKALCDFFAAQSTALTIVRPPLVYGPDAPGNFGLLMRLVSSGLPLPLGAIDNRRSFLYQDNLADFIYTCVVHPAAADQTFVVSDGDDVSTSVLLQKLGAAMGRRQWLLPVPVSLLRLFGWLVGRGDMVEKLSHSLVVDCTRARQRLAWTPPYSLDEGIRRTVRVKTG